MGGKRSDGTESLISIRKGVTADVCESVLLQPFMVYSCMGQTVNGVSAYLMSMTMFRVCVNVWGERKRN